MFSFICWYKKYVVLLGTCNLRGISGWLNKITLCTHLIGHVVVSHYTNQGQHLFFFVLIKNLTLSLKSTLVFSQVIHYHNINCTCVKLLPRIDLSLNISLYFIVLFMICYPCINTTFDFLYVILSSFLNKYKIFITNNTRIN